jgi:hypothetical protein
MGIENEVFPILYKVVKENFFLKNLCFTLAKDFEIHYYNNCVSTH